MNVSCIVVRIPVELKIACANVSGCGVSSFIDDDDNLNSLSPVLNFGLPRTFGSGIVKIPSTVPAGEVTNAFSSIAVLSIRERFPEVGTTVFAPSTTLNSIMFTLFFLGYLSCWKVANVDEELSNALPILLHLVFFTI